MANAPSLPMPSHKASFDDSNHDVSAIQLNIVCGKGNSFGGRGLKSNKRRRASRKYNKRRPRGSKMRAKPEGGCVQKKSVSDTLKSDAGKATKRYDRRCNLVKDTNEMVVAASTSMSSIGLLQRRSLRKREEYATSEKCYGDGGSEEDALCNPEERARYMAAYHARPLEMDRRAGAVSSIKPSRSSSHIFQMMALKSDDVLVDTSTDTERSSAHNDQCKDTGTTCPFVRLGLEPRLVRALTCSYCLTQPTVIQSDAIPKLLQAGYSIGAKNVCIQSETGSGKTLAYLLPIIQNLAKTLGTDTVSQDRRSGGTRCIILCPTRELAKQTVLVATRILRVSYTRIVPGCLSGGEKRKAEKARLRKGIHLLVSTPGRLIDHLVKTECFVMSMKGSDKLRWVVLDEADRLFDMGLRNQIIEIVQRLRSVVCCESSSMVSRRNVSGCPWRTVLVSATIAPSVQVLAEDSLGVEEKSWTWSKASKIGSVDNFENHKLPVGTSGQSIHDGLGRSAMTGGMEVVDLSKGTPRQLAQLYMIVSSKLRLPALVAFLVARVKLRERTVVFLSTCDSVDFHYEVFSRILPFGPEDEGHVDLSKEHTKKNGGIFGETCALFRMHGNVPHAERHLMMKRFSSASVASVDVADDNCDGASNGNGKGPIGLTKKSAILLTTDVVARGMNLPDVDWIVQYDPPCETADYVHRAGRTARAGQPGHALLFLLPSERKYVDFLKLQGLADITPLSLTSTLNMATELCAKLTKEGERLSGQGCSRRRGEAFSFAVQNRLEECVFQDAHWTTGAGDGASPDSQPRKRSPEARLKGEVRKGGADEVLLCLARRAFTAFLRAYPTKERAVRHLFNLRTLHLGHVARSFALKEPPRVITKASRKCIADNDVLDSRKKVQNSQLAFDIEALDGPRTDGESGKVTRQRRKRVLEGKLKNIEEERLILNNQNPTRSSQALVSDDEDIPHSRKEKIGRMAQMQMVAAARRLQNGSDFF